VATFLAGQTILGDRSMPTLRPVIAVVTKDAFVLLASDYGEDVRVEYGPIRRDDVADVHVVDHDAHRLGLVVRSPVVAGEIRDHFRRYVVEP
jgi:hypothetical protein